MQVTTNDKCLICEKPHRFGSDEYAYRHAGRCTARFHYECGKRGHLETLRLSKRKCPLCAVSLIGVGFRRAEKVIEAEVAQEEEGAASGGIVNGEERKENIEGDGFDNGKDGSVFEVAMR